MFFYFHLAPCEKCFALIRCLCATMFLLFEKGMYVDINVVEFVFISILYFPILKKHYLTSFGFSLLARPCGQRRGMWETNNMSLFVSARVEPSLEFDF